MSINTNNVKKSFVELAEFLNENQNKKVSSILSEIEEMIRPKAQASTVLKDENGKVIAIFCYYHKQWELIDEVEFGKKVSSTSGYNTMCKVGVRNWTKQNKRVKEVNETVLTMLENNKIDISEVASTKEKLIEEAKQVDTTDMPIGYSTEEEALEAYSKV